MFECINVCPSTACLKVMSKYIESYGKHTLAVNQRHPKKAIQEAILCFTYFSRLIENGLIKKTMTICESLHITRTKFVPTKISLVAVVF